MDEWNNFVEAVQPEKYSELFEEELQSMKKEIGQQYKQDHEFVKVSVEYTMYYMLRRHFRQDMPVLGKLLQGFYGRRAVDLYSDSNIEVALDGMAKAKMHSWNLIVPGVQPKDWYDQLEFEKCIAEQIRLAQEPKEQLAKYIEWRKKHNYGNLEKGLEGRAKNSANSRIADLAGIIQTETEGLRATTEYDADSGLPQTRLSGATSLDYLQREFGSLQPKGNLAAYWGDRKYTYEAPTLGKVDLEQMTKNAIAEFFPASEQEKVSQMVDKGYRNIQAMEVLLDEFNQPAGHGRHIVLHGPKFSWKFIEGDLKTQGYDGLITISYDEGLYVEGLYRAEPSAVGKLRRFADGLA